MLKSIFTFRARHQGAKNKIIFILLENKSLRITSRNMKGEAPCEDYCVF